MAFPPANYVACFPLQAYFVDKDNGGPLSGGYILFFEDEASTVPKNVFVQQQQPNNDYIFTNIGSRVDLSSVGTTQYLGTDSIIFLYPFDARGNEELYYIQVFSSAGVMQFDRSAWPPNVSANFTPAAGTFAGSQNVISNPQFAQVVFPAAPAGAYTYTVANASTINIAPDWNVVCPSSGTLVVTQIAETDTAAPGLPAFGLRIAPSGFTGPVALAQTISQSPRLLENGYISGSFIAQANTATSVVSMQYLPSDPTLPTIIVVSDTATLGGYALIHGTIEAPISPDINSDSPLAPGYIQVQLNIANGADVTVSCVQLVSVEGSMDVPNYIQESTPRQIDHLYHDAYPIVPVGTVIDFAGYTAPLHYLLCDGTDTYDRVVYQQLFRAITLTDTVSFTISENTYTDTNAPLLYVGMAVESSNLNTGTTISAISGTTITLSNTANATGSFPITYLPYGEGDTSAHFAVPNLLGYVTAGVGGGLLGAASSGLDGLGYGNALSTNSVMLGLTQIPDHKHVPLSPETSFFGDKSGGGANYTGGANVFTTAATTGGISTYTSQTAVSIVQPTTLLYKYIRYE